MDIMWCLLCLLYVPAIYSVPQYIPGNYISSQSLPSPTSNGNKIYLQKGQQNQQQILSQLPQNILLNMRGLVASPNDAHTVSASPFIQTSYQGNRWPYVNSDSQALNSNAQPSAVQSSAYSGYNNNLNPAYVPSKANLGTVASSNFIEKMQEIINSNESKLTKKPYTIIYPDGKIEYTDNISQIIQKYPNHTILRANDLRNYKIPMGVSENVEIKAKPVAYATYPRPHSTIIPINDLPKPEPLGDMPLERLVPNTMFGEELTTKSLPITHMLLKSSLDKSIILPNISNIKKNQESTDESVSIDFQNANIDTTSNAVGITQNTNKFNELHGNPSPTENILNDSTDAVNEFQSSTIIPGTESPYELAQHSENITNKNNSIKNNGLTIESSYEVPKVTGDSNQNIDDKIDDKIYIPNVSFLSPNETDSPFWFIADDASWDKLYKNDTTNAVYFVFIPPMVSVETDTHVTIYPNGTRVEEVTKIISNGNGKTPTVTKTIKTTNADGKIELNRLP
ncbi:uncharacterized protein LOC126975503 isoform X2 [Leptidea sinapis]|uniref:uncharacterized protein LOC126975503 isoform X2 n=1 Tax=Leptidea sinapis TaxID=189913 RepID=UPI0021C3328E|nr:uncharacterized protein LOC126975503 isoform X2 [Leptidea sinapis]